MRRYVWTSIEVVLLATVFGCAQEKSGVQGEITPVPVSLSSGDAQVEEFSLFLRQNARVIAQFPDHPLSESVFGGIVQRLEKMHGLSARDVCWQLMQEHPDDTLGLYALDKWLEGAAGIESAADQLWEIVEAHSYTSVGASALDKLLAEALDSGDLSKVSVVCRKVLSLYPEAKSSGIALLRLGQAALEAKDYHQAAEAYLRLANEFPKTYRTAGAAEHLEEAYKELGLEWWVASDIANDDPDASIKVQAELARWREWESAASRVEKRTASERERRTAALFRALGDVAKIKTFIEECDGTTEALEGQLVLARLFHKTGDHNSTVRAYETFSGSCRTMLGGATEMSVLEPVARFCLSAYRGLRDLVRTAPGPQAAASEWRAQTYEIIEQIGQQVLQAHGNLLAIPEATELQRVQALLGIADFHECQGLTGKTVETYRTLGRELRHRPEAPKWLLKVVHIQMRKWNAYDAAADACRELMHLFPESGEAREAQYLQALCWYLQGKYDSAVALLEKFIKVQTDSLTLQGQCLLAVCYFSEGDYKKAAEQFESIACSHQDIDVASRAQYGAIAMHLIDDNKQEARAALETLINNFEGTQYARDALSNFGYLMKKAP